MLELLIISGKSGAGKSTALHILEDLGYYCIDNLPLALLEHLVDEASAANTAKLAVGIDIRTLQTASASLGRIVEQLGKRVQVHVLFMTAGDEVLLMRYAATRRKHPLLEQAGSLLAALKMESAKLAAFSSIANTLIDSSNLNVHQLQQMIVQRLSSSSHATLIIQSFGFKYGVPLDSDMVFDLRHLPNPYWHAELKALDGLSAPVQQFLNDQADYVLFYNDLLNCLQKWVAQMMANNRPYVTVSIGCTGGKHRSVFMAEKLKAALAQTEAYQLQVFHREQKSWLLSNES